MLYLFGLALAAGLSVAIAAFAGALGQGRAVAAAMDAAARQPEAGGRLFTFLILGLALIEALTIYALIVSLMLISRLPAVSDVLDLIKVVGH
jgi:F-type H+-transporting ATPase subunit c